ncbi:hypothetical protein FIV42_27415 [Persicimonas caeni]|uniref:Uncharacterized protein n=1 Tax=Persicimonas caeni TaxID=2292766 RepID=A0A4Y6Q1K3_PERCE|nr:hypothetical protein [Persicimonas caeni]QDG54339.1 hypothetical protein FIV42_27415 [Persicimonas caeni]QED35560.1 hypothetical protein FRD00_27410 [Persicimonas caeni]
MISNPGDRKQQVEEAKKRRQKSESSAPKEEEPNDFPKQATLFELGGDLRPIEATIGQSDDKDWFALTSQNGETWQVEATVTPKSDTLDPVIRVAVADSDDAPITYNIAGPGEPETIPILAVSSTAQRVMVTGNDGTTGDYEFSFQKRLSGGAVESEPNDDIDVATRFEAPGEIQGFYDRPEDRDVYFVPRKNLTGEAFTLEVSPIDDVMQQVRVYTHRDMKAPYLSLHVPPTEAAGLPNVSLPDDVLGVWIVLTAGDSFSRDQSYRLKLLGHPPVEHGLEVEPNDDAETAQQIDSSTKLAGYFHSIEDVDHFRLFVDGIPEEGQSATGQGAVAENAADAGLPSDDMPEPANDAGMAQADAGDVGDAGSDIKPADPLDRVADKEPADHVVRVTIAPKHEKTRLALAWSLPRNQGSPTVLEASEPGENVTLCNTVVEDDYVDLEVRRLAAAEGMLDATFDYGLIAENVQDVPGLEIEPNDSRDTADKLEPTQKRIGYIARAGDTDVFAFAVPFPESPAQSEGDTGAPVVAPTPPTPRQVQLTLGANSLNLGFKLLDDEGGLVAQVNRAGAGAEEKLQVDLPPGLYFVHVAAKRGSACEPYEMSVKVAE